MDRIKHYMEKGKNLEQIVIEHMEEYKAEDKEIKRAKV